MIRIHIHLHTCVHRHTHTHTYTGPIESRYIEGSYSVAFASVQTA
jgi:hypothetical protein